MFFNEKAAELFQIKHSEQNIKNISAIFHSLIYYAPAISFNIYPLLDLLFLMQSIYYKNQLVKSLTGPYKDKEIKC